MSDLAALAAKYAPKRPAGIVIARLHEGTVETAAAGPVGADGVFAPRAGNRMMESGLGWMRSPAHRGARMWWHNGGTNGSRSFTAFIPETGEAVAAVTNSPKPVENAAKRAWAGTPAPAVAA